MGLWLGTSFIGNIFIVLYEGLPSRAFVRRSFDESFYACCHFRSPFVSVIALGWRSLL